MLTNFVNWVLNQLAQPIVLFGFFAQFVFFLRFAVQWYESEKRGKSQVPVAFWWLSIAGAIMILVWATLTKNLVIGTANVLQLGIYGRNLMLIYRSRRPALPACGSCGHAVRGIAGLTCPACGGDLREVGIIAGARVSA